MFICFPLSVFLREFSGASWKLTFFSDGSSLSSVLSLCSIIDSGLGRV